MAATPDRLSHYRANLEGRLTPADFHNDQPQPGYYRRRLNEGARFVPAAIWDGADGQLYCEVDGQSADAAEQWPWIMRRPVPFDAYKHYKDRGFWPDEPAPPGNNRPPPDQADGEEASGQASSALETSSPEADDDDAAYAKQRETAANLIEQAKPLLALDNPDEKADLIANVKDAIVSARKESNRLREEEKKAWIEGGRAVDARWKGITDPLDKAADMLRDILEGILKRQRAEAARKAEEAAKQAREAGLTETPPPAAPAKPKVGGAVSGRSTSLVKTRVAVIEDMDALYAFMKQTDSLREYMTDWCTRSLRNPGVTSIPGVRIEIKERAR